MKTKQVHAQRKYAQGAHIPISNPSTPVERRVGEPGTQNTSKVFYNNNNAKNLLDIVSFSNIHRHTDPIVLVKRLENTLEVIKNERNIPNHKIHNQAIENHNVIKLPERREPNQEIVLTSPPSPQSRKKAGRPFKFIKKRLLSKKVRRSNRLRGKPSPKLKKAILFKKKIKPKDKTITTKRIIKFVKAPVIEANDLEAVCPSTDDDEQPLTYFKKKPQQTTKDDTGTEEPSTPTKNKFLKTKKKSNNEPAILLESTLIIEPSSSVQVESSSVTADSNNAGLYYGTNGIERWISESTKDITKSKDFKIPKLIQKKKKIVKSPKKIQNVKKNICSPKNTSSAKNTLPAKNTSLVKNNLSAKKTLPAKTNPLAKTTPPAKTAQFTKTTPLAKTMSPAKAAPPAKTAPSAKTAPPAKAAPPAKTAPSAKTAPPAKAAATAKAVAPAKAAPPVKTTPSAKNTSPARNSCPPKNICPSVKFVYLKDVMSASQEDIDGNCNNCTRCGVIKKVVELSKLVRDTRKTTRSSTLDIDPNTDVTVSSYTNIPSSRVHGTSIQPDKPRTSKDEERPAFFMDLLPGSDKIVEVSWGKIPNRKDSLMSARLISKTNLTNSGDITLAHNETLLDKLLQLYKQKTHDEKQSNEPKKTEDEVTGKVSETNGDKPPEKRLHSNDSATNDTKKKKIENNFPRTLDHAKLVDAPVFYPTAAEFTDPISYFEKVMPIASQFGICKVVPPADFNPTCTLSETNRFTVTNQYIPRLYTRWGPAFREMCAIRSYLASQKVHFTRAPLLEGLEVNLPKMYHTVQRLGGLKNVFDKKRWNRVAEEMNFNQLTNPSKKLEQIYVKYLLPYDTLTNRERQMKISEVEQMWQKKNKKMLARAINPLQRQKRLLGDSNLDADSDSDQDASSDSDEEETSGHASDPLAEAEECIVPGRTMNLNNFEKVAQNAFKMYIPPNEEASTRTIENLYWKLVLFGADHVCVNSASVDTGDDGYGFTKNKSSPYGKHPWNLKMISQNNGNILRPLGGVLGLTVPTLHLGMIFSTSCWHRDPHGLPWLEYMHQGPEKIWYGIPDEQSQNFRKAVEVLCPTVCQNKGIWLSSDITMIPPNMLLEHEVSLSKITQKPREFVIVFPKAYSSSICTGYTISESVYFATQSWLGTMGNVFQELRESCEPTTFALEQLLIAIARDPRSSLAVLQRARATLSTAVTDELAARATLKRHGLQVTVNKGTRGKRRLIRHQDECEICRTTLYLSKVKGVFGKQSALCVQHALRVLVENKTDSEIKKKIDTNIELEIFFTKNEFEEIEQNLQRRLLSINGVDK